MVWNFEPTVEVESIYRFFCPADDCKCCLKNSKNEVD